MGRNNFFFKTVSETLCTPICDTEEEVWNYIQKLYAYRDAVHEYDEVTVYAAMRIFGYRTPAGLPEYNRNVILSSGEIKKLPAGGYICKFDTIKRRGCWMDPAISNHWESDEDIKIYH